MAPRTLALVVYASTLLAAALGLCRTPETKFDDETGAPCPQFASAAPARPGLETSNGNVIVKLGAGKKLGFEVAGGDAQYFPDAYQAPIDAAKSELQSELEDVKGGLENALAGGLKTAEAAINATAIRVARAENELGLGDGDAGTTGGLGVLIQQVVDGGLNQTDELVTVLSSIDVLAGDLLAEAKKQTEQSAGGVGASWTAIAGTKGAGELWRAEAGGGKCLIGGRSFIEGMSGLYQCKFTSAGVPVGKHTVTAPAIGLSSSLVECDVPEWDHDLKVRSAGESPSAPATVELLEADIAVQYVGLADSKMAFFDAPPVISVTGDGAGAACSAPGGCGTIEITPGDSKKYTVDISASDANQVVLKATSSEQKVVKNSDISFSGSGPQRTMTIKTTGALGKSTIKVTGTDKYTLVGNELRLNIEAKAFPDCQAVKDAGLKTGKYTLTKLLDGKAAIGYCKDGWALMARVTRRSCQDHWRTGALRVSATEPPNPGGSTTSRYSDADINAYKTRSPYNGKHSYWMQQTAGGCGGRNMYCKTSCNFNGKNHISGNANCYRCSTSFNGGDYVGGSPNTGTRGLGHHHYNSNAFAWQRHPESGNNCGFRSDNCGSMDGNLWMK